MTRKCGALMTPLDRPLRIAMLAYRGKPHVGGQGVYIRHLTKALSDLGHHVEVLGGQPFPVLDERVPLVELPSLDIYNDYFPLRMPGLWELKNWKDVAEVASFSMGTFPEPMAFSLRAWDHLRHRRDDFDLVHDNQTLGWGVLAIDRNVLPVLATIHHPITVDRQVEVAHAATFYKKMTLRRWYAFTRMQTQVARRLRRVVTVSENSFKDIVEGHKVLPDRMAVVPVGVDPNLFKPIPDITRAPGMLITTASADSAMKGQRYLLEAVAKLRTERPEVTLTLIGKPKEGGTTLATIEDLGLSDVVTFVSGVTDQRIVELYSEAEAAVVPSLYEGFSLPAIEAMSCGIPLVATTGGALPEVVGNDGETAFTVEPGDSNALAAKLAEVLDHPEAAARVGAAGRVRVGDQWSWRHTAEKTVEQYRILLAG